MSATADTSRDFASPVPRDAAVKPAVEIVELRVSYALLVGLEQGVPSRLTWGGDAGEPVHAPDHPRPVPDEGHREACEPGGLVERQMFGRDGTGDRCR